MSTKDIIFMSRDYGYNIDEFLKTLNEDSTIEDDAKDYLEEYVNDHIKEIYDYYNKNDFKKQYENAEDVEDEEEIDKKWINDVMKSVDRFKGPIVKEIKKWMKYAAENPSDEIEQTIYYMFRSQEAYILYTILKNISEEDITLDILEEALASPELADLVDFLDQVDVVYKDMRKKEKKISKNKYETELEIKNKNDAILLQNIVKDLDEDPLEGLKWEIDIIPAQPEIQSFEPMSEREKRRLIKRLIKPLFSDLKAVETLEEALELNDSLFEGKLGRFLHSKMETKSKEEAISLQLNVLARIIAYFTNNNYEALYLNVNKSYYNTAEQAQTTFKEYDNTSLFKEVQFALREYLPSHKLFDIRGDFHNVRPTLTRLMQGYTPFAIEIVHSAMIHLFGTNNKNVKFGGDTRKVWNSFKQQIADSDKKDASTVVKAIVTDPEYGEYFSH